MGYQIADHVVLVGCQIFYFSSRAAQFFGIEHASDQWSLVVIKSIHFPDFSPISSKSHTFSGLELALYNSFFLAFQASYELFDSMKSPIVLKKSPIILENRPSSLVLRGPMRIPPKFFPNPCIHIQNIVM